MKQIGWIISRYLVTTIAPYFIFSWMLLSVILFVQQAGRYSDIFFSVNIPTNLVWQLTIALVPNVIAFTCPMAMLVATIIGLTKMQGDSELVAIRASGVGNLQIAIPIMLFGILLSIFAFIVNFQGVPLAASLVRTVALQTAIKKLESPIEPGVFNTEVAGYTIYAKGGDLETGRWTNIFIYQEDKASGTVRLITSGNGRIDTSGQVSELVLENSTISTLPMEPGEGKYVSESIGEVRLAIRTKRADLIDRLSRSEVTSEEMGLQQLSEFAATATGPERVEAQLIWQRRVLLSITPLIFCLLGTVIVLRFNRGGRGFGISAALVVLIGFYLLAFMGEQLARLGLISVYVGGLIPIAGSVAVIVWFSVSRRIVVANRALDRVKNFLARLRPPRKKLQMGNIFVDLTTGLRDFDIVRNLIKNYLLTVVFLTAIFQIFTAFELWRFAGAFEGGIWQLLKYLVYLLPFVYLQIAPSAAMIATLATYVVKSRNNEIVTWTSSGQSVYRLLMPCFLLAALLGGVNWLVQERLLPRANQLQEATRTFIRNRGVGAAQPGKYWVATERRIYSFDLDGGRSSKMPVNDGKRRDIARPLIFASDNESGRDHKAARELRAPHRSGTWALGVDQQRISASDNEMHQELGPLSLDVQGRIEEGSDLAGASWAVISASDNVREKDTQLAIHRNLAEGPGTPFLLTAAPGLALIFASDNEKRDVPCPSPCVRNLTIYEFAENGRNLQAVYRADGGYWEGGKIVLVGNVEKNALAGPGISVARTNGEAIAESSNPFAGIRLKPNQVNSSDLRRKIEDADSELEARNFEVALQKKYVTLMLPFIMALFTAPFSLSLSRKGKAAAIGSAVGLWLVFTGISSVFEQLGLNGLLAPAIAVWSPLLLFGLLGVFLLTRVRT